MKFIACVAALMLLAVGAQAAPVLTVADADRMRDVDDPQIAPAGDWIVYTIRTVDTAADKRETHLWMTSFDGARTVQLTPRKGESESTPPFSPDGRWLAFLSGRADDKKNDQVWLLDRQGGEAQQVTSFPGGVVDFAWSPDGKRLALIVADEDKSDTGDDKKTKPPIVIDRFAFMQDINGYQTALRDPLYVFDIASRKADLLTPGA